MQNLAKRSKLISGKLKYYFPLARPVIEIDDYDLLPLAERHLAVGKRDCNGEAEDRSADVGVTVAVMPPGVMLVRNVLRDDALPGSFEIGDESRLVFDNRDTARRMRAKDRESALPKSGFFKALLDSVRDIDYVSVAAGLDVDYMVDNHVFT
jgi:hypothetical protein